MNFRIFTCQKNAKLKMSLDYLKGQSYESFDVWSFPPIISPWARLSPHGILYMTSNSPKYWNIQNQNGPNGANDIVVIKKHNLLPEMPTFLGFCLIAPFQQNYSLLELTQWCQRYYNQKDRWVRFYGVNSSAESYISGVFCDMKQRISRRLRKYFRVWISDQGDMFAEINQSSKLS
jgi:hypothetical protein